MLSGFLCYIPWLINFNDANVEIDLFFPITNSNFSALPSNESLHGDSGYASIKVWDDETIRYISKQIVYQ